MTSRFRKTLVPTAHKWMMALTCLFMLYASTSSCDQSKAVDIAYDSETLQIERLGDKVYRHISELDVPGYGKFSCNGMVVVEDGKVLIFDTPANVAASRELLNWLADSCGFSIKAVVVNHFHDDCLIGLNEFHKRGITSYAYETTAALARDAGLPVPQNPIPDSLDLYLGKLRVINFYPGPGHTSDNLVSYVVDEKVLFGGCLVKPEGGNKGNLSDADTLKWSQSVRNVLLKFPDSEIVIPGHGQPGGPRLLEYTIALFDPDTVNE